ncbi:peptidyl-tRNA hydrolase 2 [Phlyctochytrium arcticum]|nr:peptidyl-tRNA hydrolase 2 [Phlyctochytrium arcticum]
MLSFLELSAPLLTRQFSYLHLTAAAASGLFLGIKLQNWWILRQSRRFCQNQNSSKSKVLQSDSSSESDSEDERPKKEHKMILVVRNDLGMGKGKIAAQCCHAAVAAVQTASRTQPNILSKWERYGAAKVAVKINSEKELMDLYDLAGKSGLIAEYIEDAGRTQIPEGSRTVLAIGPGPIPAIDKITRHLKLL